MSETIEQYNARVTEEERQNPEGDNVRKARCAVGRITQMEHRMHLLQVEIEGLQRRVVDECRLVETYLKQAERGGENGREAAWVKYWRRIGLPHWLKQVG